MLKLRISGLAALSFAMGSALAQGGAGGTGLQDPLDSFGLFSDLSPGSTPLVHPTSFSALAAPRPPLSHLPFDGLAGPDEKLVPGFDPAHWNDASWPPRGGIGKDKPVVTGPTAPPRPVPEPNVSALLLAGLAAGAWAARRRKR